MLLHLLAKHVGHASVMFKPYLSLSISCKQIFIQDLIPTAVLKHHKEAGLWAGYSCHILPFLFTACSWGCPA